MGYDNPNDVDSYSPPDNTVHYPQDVGWDNEPSHNTNTSPDASFSALDPNSILSNRYVPLPSSRPNTSVPDTTTSRLQLEISNVTSVHKNLSAQLGSIMEKLESFSPQTLPLLMIEHQFISGASQGFHPPNSAIPNNNILNNHSFSLSPLINFGQINVNGFCSPVRQLHLLNYFLYSSFGVLSLNDTHLTPSSAKFIYQNEHSQYNFKSYWAPSLLIHDLMMVL
ncbi:hypothetical protein RhiirC2_798405, partial [Rhizophagus irregularis]